MVQQAVFDAKARYWSKIAILTLGDPRRNTAITLQYEKTRMVGLRHGEKILNMFTRFDRIHQRYRRTPRDGIGRVYAKHRAAKNQLSM